MTSDGHRIYPETLRAATVEVYQAADRLDAFAIGELPELHLHDGALGLLGRMANTITAYNNALNVIGGQAKDGAGRVRDVAAALDRAADFYETQDAEDFERMKNIGKDLN